MKAIILALTILLCNGLAVSQDLCFIAQENGKILKQEGDCKTRYSPASTFKIALALIGYDAHLLKNDTNPVLPCKPEYDVFINVCKGPHSPKTWMRDSCVWYSQVLTQQLGQEQFTNYMVKFSYGNQDVSGDPGKNNGLTHAWLSSSLAISPAEQIGFLQKMTHNKLPVSNYAYTMTKKIMFIQEMAGGWKLYGKTGLGEQFDRNKQKTGLHHGWFVGWIEKGNRIITFAVHLNDHKKHNTFTSLRARNEALIKLGCFINELET